MVFSTAFPKKEKHHRLITHITFEIAMGDKITSIINGEQWDAEGDATFSIYEST